MSKQAGNSCVMQGGDVGRPLWLWSAHKRDNSMSCYVTELKQAKEHNSGAPAEK